MPKFLYIFSYQTPEQREASAREDSCEEASGAVFIEANSEAEALAWGREISEEFLHRLPGQDGTSWKAANYDHWVETDPQAEYPADVLAAVPTVGSGVYPDFSALKR